MSMMPTLYIRRASNRFNPLNQVYVFNEQWTKDAMITSSLGFNPLNQVYVFNMMSMTFNSRRKI